MQIMYLLGLDQHKFLTPSPVFPLFLPRRVRKKDKSERLVVNRNEARFQQEPRSRRIITKGRIEERGRESIVHPSFGNKSIRTSEYKEVRTKKISNNNGINNNINKTSRL
jgi:hypothetical protein